VENNICILLQIHQEAPQSGK